MVHFSVTIAVPTYNRPEKLRRALRSIAGQTYKASEVIISDNATTGFEVDNVVDEFRASISNLRFIKQEINLGPVDNFFYCLRSSSSDYFMWLADDDEISPGCLKELVHMVKTIPNLASAIPRWHLSTDSSMTFVEMPARSYDSNLWFMRAAKFMYQSTDELFYGLHRRSDLVNCKISNYVWPNKSETLNLVYPFLLGMVISGKVIVTDNKDAFWKNHDYGVKYHGQDGRPASIKFFNYFRFLMRMINLQILYLSRVQKKGGILVSFFLVFVSLSSIIRCFVYNFSVRFFSKK